jgi:hypothetical protein
MRSSMFVQSHCCSAKHGCKEKANGNVMGNLNVYVHGVVPMRKLVCYGGIKCDRTT